MLNLDNKVCLTVCFIERHTEALFSVVPADSSAEGDGEDPVNWLDITLTEDIKKEIEDD